MNVHIGTISVEPQIMPIVSHMGTRMDYINVGPARITIDFQIHCFADELPPGASYHEMFDRLAKTIEEALSGKSTPEQLYQKFNEVIGPRRIKA